MAIDFTVMKFTGYCIPIRELDENFLTLYQYIAKGNNKIFIRRQDNYGNEDGEACLAVGRIRHLRIMNTMAVSCGKVGLYGGGKNYACIPLTDYNASEVKLFDKEIKSLEKHMCVDYRFRKYFREWLFTFFH